MLFYKIIHNFKYNNTLSKNQKSFLYLYQKTVDKLISHVEIINFSMVYSLLVFSYTISSCNKNNINWNAVKPIYFILYTAI